MHVANEALENHQFIKWLICVGKDLVK